uniref:Glyco_18 domain-containing protein n=1 Tax=Rhabditophanes sp. KR3021 TaxID=114890 RepID=A0AC35TXN2_9BILA
MLIDNCYLDEQNKVVFPQLNDLKSIMELKKVNPNLKILVTLLPYSDRMRKIIYDNPKFDELVDDIDAYIRKSGLDGIDIDWEFPAWGKGSSSAEKGKFTELVTKLFVKLKNNGTNNYLITAATAGPYNIGQRGYDLPALARYLDFIQIMNYDFHIYSKLQPIVGFNAPLRAEPYEVFIAAKMNSVYSTEWYLKNGFPKEKLVFGIPTYGRGCTLLEKHLHYPYSPAVADSFLGSSYTYPNACPLLKDPSFNLKWDNHAASNYLINNNRDWVGIETARSVSVKAGYAGEIGLRGIMIFALYTDDYEGTCPGSKRKFWLTYSAKKAFLKKSNYVRSL